MMIVLLKICIYFNSPTWKQSHVMNFHVRESCLEVDIGLWTKLTVVKNRDIMIKDYLQVVYVLKLWV